MFTIQQNMPNLLFLAFMKGISTFPIPKMQSSCLSSLILFLFFCSQLTVIDAQVNLSCLTCMIDRGNYTSTSAYGKNLKMLVSNVTRKTQIENGFYEISVGQDPNKVYGIAACRGDVSESECSTCLNDAATRLPAECPTEKEAIGYYYGRCMFRYSDRPIFGMKEQGPNCTQGSQHNIYKIPSTDEEKFIQKLSILFDGLRKNVSARDSRYKFATGYENVTASLQVYGLMQCNPDLTHSDCSDCLQTGITHLNSCCTTVVGAGIYGPSCSIEFENYPFFVLQNRNSPPSSSSPAGHTENKLGKGRDKHKTWIIIAVVLFVLMLVATFILCLSSRRKRRIQKQVENQKVQISCVDSLQFEFRIIQVATDDFSDAQRLGKGSLTRVYKGMLPNQQEIAVKRLSNNNGRYGELEFNNEVLLLTDLQHRNLVKLLGSCVNKDSWLLIYEYLPNESLDLFLSDPVKRAKLNWETRHKIILGIARGLLYLHEDSQLRVIHRDLKPENILLDVEMNPKISNFSKASLVQADQTRGGSNTVVRTYGYMPPEYVEQGHFSVKSDVFSFGVLLLEIISGQLIHSFMNGEKGESLLSFVWRNWLEGKALDVVDEILLSIEAPQIMRCINIALLCVQEDPTSRPTMSTIAFMLKSSLVSLAEPLRPAFAILSEIDQSSSSSNSQKSKSYEATINGVSITELHPR